jgi:hypothetical protein
MHDEKCKPILIGKEKRGDLLRILGSSASLTTSKEGLCSLEVDPHFPGPWGT